MGSWTRGGVLALMLGLTLSGVASALPEQNDRSVHAQVASDPSIERQQPSVFEQHTCGAAAARPAGPLARAPLAADDWRVLFAQLIGVYALAFVLVRGLFGPEAARRDAAASREHAF